MSDPQTIPEATKSIVSSRIAINRAGISNAPRMILTDFETDQIKYSLLKTESGASTIKVREDLVPALRNIKNILNSYDIPLSCNSQNISIDSENISDLARVGLEISLNRNAALTKVKNPDFSDYYVAPHPVIQNKLKLYATVYRPITFLNIKYKPFRKPLYVYDIRETYGIKPPSLVRIFKNLLDISQIFEDYGFINTPPHKDFFSYSDNIKSNWFSFYNPLKINIGYTYKELLSTVYDNNGESIWLSQNRSWDGERFI